MKKWLSLLLCVLMLLPTLAACGGTDTPDTPDAPDGEQALGEDGAEPGADEEMPNPDGVYIPTAKKQRETYEVVTAEGFENGPYLVKTVYLTEQVIVANVIVTPEAYAVDPTGVKDSTAGIQAALDDCYALGGGTVFLPVGQYLVTKTVGIPFGVVLHGDWQDPDLTDTPEYGTVILAKTPVLEGLEIYDPTAKPLFELRSEQDGNNGLIGLTVYYPEQDINDVKPYGYTVYGERPRMVMLRDLTLINAYQGIGACLGGESNTHELLQVENVRMTVLSMGYKATLSREIGYTMDLRISPRYWRDAAGAYACPDADALRDFCREHTIGMEFYALDLNQYTNLYVEGCHTALLSREGFWGVFYGLEIKDCMYGVVAESLSGSSGVTIANATIEADVYAVANYAVNMGTLKLADVALTGKGGVHTAVGAKTIVDNEDDLASYVPREGTYIKPAEQLYVADVAALNGVKEDAGPAIQEALDTAALTGGIVYLPHGVYSVYTPLSVPTGVELRGAMAMAVRDKATMGCLVPGTVLITYVNEGDFITLSESAGVSGLRIFYPSYDVMTAQEMAKDGDERYESVVAVRGTGANVYAVNMVISSGLVGIDFTDCDAHLVKQCFGCTSNNFVRAGGKGGVIEGVLCNLTFTHRQPFYVGGYYETDRINEANIQIQQKASSSAFLALRDGCDVVYIKDAEDQQLNNVFMYACRTMLRTENAEVVGYNVTSDVQGISPMFLVQENSDVVIFNPLRTGGKSHECDESSSLTIYNRINNNYHLEPTYRSDSGLEENAGGEVISTVELLNCDSVGTVKNVALNTDAAFIKEGKGSLKSTYADANTLLSATFAPVDATKLGGENVYLHLWMYVEDPNAITGFSGNHITLSGSKGKWSYNWSMPSTVRDAGWNEILLPLASGWKGTTEMPLDGFDTLTFKIARYGGDARPPVYFDDIYLCSVLPYAEMAFEEPEVLEEYVRPMPSVEQEPTRIMIYDGESLDALEGSSIKGYATLNTDKAYVKEGNASLKVQTNGQVIFEMKIPATDASAYKHYGFLHMWVYIDDPASGGQIELTSSGTYDKAEKSWGVNAYATKRGWNEVWLPFHGGAAGTTSVFDPAYVNYMRIYLSNGAGGSPVYFDDVYLCNTPDASLYNEGNTGKTGTALTTSQDNLPILHRCENAQGVSGVSINSDPAFIKEGKGSFVSTPNVVRMSYAFAPLDISEYMEGYLHLWMYIENPEDIRNGYIELTSSGTYDKDEYAFQLTQLGLQSGWNELYLPMSAPTSKGTLNPKSFNYLRIYTHLQDGKIDHNVYFDDIRFVMEK